MIQQRQNWLKRLNAIYYDADRPPSIQMCRKGMRVLFPDEAIGVIRNKRPDPYRPAIDVFLPAAQRKCVYAVAKQHKTTESAQSGEGAMDAEAGEAFVVDHVREVFPFVVASFATGLLILAGLRWWRKSWQKAACHGTASTIILCGYFLFFFRDPERIPPTDAGVIVSGADGTVASITDIYEATYLKTNCVRAGETVVAVTGHNGKGME